MAPCIALHPQHHGFWPCLELHRDPRANKATEKQTLSGDRELDLRSDFPKIILGFTDIDGLVIQRGTWSTEGEHTEVLRERAPRQDARAPSPSPGTHSVLTIDEELGPRQPLLVHHGLPILPGPSHPQRRRALGVAGQGHALPNLNLQVPQGLGEVRGSCRREQWEGAWAGLSPPCYSTPASQCLGLCRAEPRGEAGLQNARARCLEGLRA